jgi:hypothetical protein
MATYRTKPVEIEAMQFTGVNLYGVDAAVKFDDWINEHKGFCICIYHSQHFIVRDDFGNKQVAKPGDYIIAGGDGILHVVKEKDFVAQYERVK